MYGRSSMFASLAGMALMAAAASTPEDRAIRQRARETARIRRCFERLLAGISKAHDFGFPNISRQQRRQLERKAIAALTGGPKP